MHTSPSWEECSLERYLGTDRNTNPALYILLRLTRSEKKRGAVPSWQEQRHMPVSLLGLLGTSAQGTGYGNGLDWSITTGAGQPRFKFHFLSLLRTSYYWPSVFPFLIMGTIICPIL